MIRKYLVLFLFLFLILFAGCTTSGSKKNTKETIESFDFTEKGYAKCYASSPEEKTWWERKVSIQSGFFKVDESGSIVLASTTHGLLLLNTPIGFLPVVFVTDVTPLSIEKFLTDSKDDMVYLGKNHKPTNQHDGSQYENVSCGYASASSALDRINKTCGKGKIKIPKNTTLMKYLRDKVPPGINGVSTGGLAIAVGKLLNESGLAENFTIEVKGRYGKYRNGSKVRGVDRSSGIPIEYEDWRITLEDVIREAFIARQEVILLLESGHNSHFVLFDDVRKIWNKTTKKSEYYVSFMDPWTGTIQEAKYNKTTNKIEWSPNGYREEWEITFMISISPKFKPQITPFCGDGIISEGEECDPKSNKSNSGCALGQVCVDCYCMDADIFPYCGDGMVTGGEECDPASSLLTCGKDEYCTPNCKCAPVTYFCGDGVISEGEECDPKANETNHGCPADKVCNEFCQCVASPITEEQEKEEETAKAETCDYSSEITSCPPPMVCGENNYCITPEETRLEIVSPKQGSEIPYGELLTIEWRKTPEWKGLTEVYVDDILAGVTQNSSYMLNTRDYSIGMHRINILAYAIYENDRALIGEATVDIVITELS